jgi:hypothetical protein
MEVSAIREDLLSYFRIADEKKVQAVYTLLEADIIHVVHPEAPGPVATDPETIGGPVVLQPNHYINSLEDFWKVTSLFKKDTVRKVLDLFSGVVNDDLIEALFATGKPVFFINENGSVLLAGDSPALVARYGALSRLDAVHALKTYGVDKLEEASEKNYVKLR